MANTKQIEDRADRKAKKRELRKALKATHAQLSAKEKKAFKKSETVGLRAWLAEQQKGE